MLRASGDGTVYQKSWEETSAQITVDFSKKRIGYPKDLGFKVNKDTTCNFSDNENFVVLACVTMLLDKGYRPESLELEREWALGHEQKSGRADICINDERGDTLAIVECKTPGTEFKNEFKNMQSDGGQLLSYWQQERATRWLVLFACDFINNEIVPDQVSINCSDDENFIALAKRDDTIALYRDAHTVEQLHQVWTETYNQQVEGNILFGDRSTAYHPMVPPLLKKDLVDFRPKTASSTASRKSSATTTSPIKRTPSIALSRSLSRSSKTSSRKCQPRRLSSNTAKDATPTKRSRTGSRDSTQTA